MIKEKKFEIPEKPEFSKIEHIRQNLYNIHETLYKRYGRTAKPAVEATNVWLASVSIVEWVIFLRTKRKERLGKIWQLYKPKLRVNRLRVIRIHKACESMRFHSGPEVFVHVNRNYVLTEYVLNENDCIFFFLFALQIKATSSDWIDFFHIDSKFEREDE